MAETLTPIWPLVVGVFGLMVGSFLNVCIARLPHHQSIVAPRSHCLACGAPVRWFDNLPVASYLWLRGRCRACGARYGARYLVVEIVTGVLFAVHGWVFGMDPIIVPRLCLAAIVVALFVIDLEHQLLPNALTYPGTIVALIASVLLPPGLKDAVIGALVGAGVLLAIRWVWRRATGVEGMGLGDVKMLAMVGAFLGWQMVLLVLFLGSLSGALIGIALAGAGRGTMKTRLPFGTFLGAGAVAASLFGAPLVHWYVSLLR